jgi:hypothetical protein
MRALALAIASVAVAAPAHAAPPPAALVDEMMAAGAAEAPIVMRIDPAELPALHAFARSRVPWPVREAFDDGLGSFTGLLAGDPFTPDGWGMLGLDPTKPIVIAIGRTTGSRVLGAQGERDPIIKGGERPDRTARPPATLLVDIRVIVGVTDPTRARVAIARAKRLLPGLRFGDPGKTLAIDLELGPGGDDHVGLAAAALAGATSTRKAVLARLRAAGADVLTGSAPIALHVDPRRLLETALWLRADEVADRNGPRVDEVRAEVAEVDPVLRASFGALGATIDLQGGTATVHATLAVVPRSPVAAALAATRDSGLPRPADTPDAVLHVHSYVAALSALITPPTGAMTFDLPARTAFDAGDASAVVDGLAWPAELGATMAHVVAVEPRSRVIFDGIGDAVLVAQSIGDDLPHSAAALEVAVSADADAALRPLIDAVWGASQSNAGVTTWGGGRVRPFARSLPHARTIGAALGDSAPAYLTLARTAPPPAPGTVLELHAAPVALGLVTPLAVFAGTLDLTARYDAATVAIDATLSP